MKIIHVNTFDSIGGAAKASIRLHKSLLDRGIDSHFLTQCGSLNIRNIKNIYKNNVLSALTSRLRSRVDSIPLLAYPRKTKTPWNVGWLNGSVNSIIKEYSGDIVHIHWIASGLMSLDDLSKIESKTVFTLHDSWIFTGGCHVIGDCKNFQSICAKCPQLGSRNHNDLSLFCFKRKLKVIEKLKPVFIAPSNWMANQAQSSTLLKDSNIQIIPNGVDTKIFCPRSKIEAREYFGFSLFKKIIMFGANSVTGDENKGFNHLLEIHSLISNSLIGKNFEIVVFGGVDEKTKLLCKNMQIRFMGKVIEEKLLARLYSVANVICVPSFQESFGLVALEAMSCGIPVVAYNTSGLKDIIVHGVSGILAKPFDKKEIAYGLIQILVDEELSGKMSIESRARAVNIFDSKKIADSHIKLYEDLLS